MRIMHRVFFLAAATVLLSAQSPAKLKLGSAMPAFSLPGVDGKSLDNRQVNGPVLVVFLSTECPYVMASEDRINALAKTFKGKIAFMGINSNANESTSNKDENMTGMKAHATSKGYVFPYLKDENQDVARAYGALCTPDFLLFDASHKLVYRGRMDDSAFKPDAVTKRDLKEALEAVASGRMPNAHQISPRGCAIKWKHGA